MATDGVHDPGDAVYGQPDAPEAELREVLSQVATQVDMATARAAAEVMRRRLEGREHSDSGEILAAERVR